MCRLRATPVSPLYDKVVAACTWAHTHTRTLSHTTCPYTMYINICVHAYTYTHIHSFCVLLHNLCPSWQVCDIIHTYLYTQRYAASEMRRRKTQSGVHSWRAWGARPHRLNYICAIKQSYAWQRSTLLQVLNECHLPVLHTCVPCISYIIVHLDWDFDMCLCGFICNDLRMYM